MINTHEKLIETVLDQKISKKELYEIMGAKNYKGTEEELITDLLLSIGATDAYMYDSQKVDDCEEHLTEEEYFQILIKEMNLNY